MAGLIPFDRAPDALAIRCSPLDYIADAPDEVRWRAWWDHYKDTVRGIDLRCYPVIKTTAQGAWIDPDAYHHGGWQFSGNQRWVSNIGGQAWAKPKREEALHSLAIRYERWGGRLAQDIGYYRAAGSVMAALLEKDRPHLAGKAARMADLIAHAATEKRL